MRSISSFSCRREGDPDFLGVTCKDRAPKGGEKKMNSGSRGEEAVCDKNRKKEPDGGDTGGNEKEKGPKKALRDIRGEERESGVCIMTGGGERGMSKVKVI